MSTTTTHIEKKKMLAPKLRFKDFREDWVTRTLEEVSDTFKSGESITSKEIFDSAEFPVYGGNGLRGYTNTFTHEGFYVLIGRQGALCGNINRVNGKSYISEHAIAVRANNLADTEWLAQKLDDMKLNRLSESSAQPGLAVGKLLKLKLPFPTLPEQQKIATFLSAIDEKIQQLTRKKELLEQYKKGVMQRLFLSESMSELGFIGFKDDRIPEDETNPKILSSKKSKFRPLRFKPDFAKATSGSDENGKAYPRWEEKRLGEVCTFFSGGTPASTNKKFYSGTIPFIGSGNIYDSEVFSFISDEALNSSSAKMVGKGDLLYALYGANSGEVAISKINGAINQAILCIRSEECIEYLYYILLLDKDKIVAKYLQGGQGNLSANIIKKLKFKLPSIDEQQKIASYLSSLDTKIETVATQIAQSQTFKKGLLQEMFV